MENLSIQDTAPQQPQTQQGGPPPLGPRAASQSGPPQLPPQMFTTAAQLLDLTDKKLMVALRDGRKLIGVLRSWDQFANLVLQSTIERVFVPSASNASDGSESRRGLYADIPKGIFLVRGENVLLLGEIDLDKDDDPPPGYELADQETVLKLSAERKAAEKTREKTRIAKLSTLGFEGENIGEVLL